MAIIDQTKTASKDVCWGRGDSDAKGFVIQDNAGVVVDITGFTFKMTVSSDKDPVDQSNEQFSMNGVIGVAVSGTVSFAPLITDTDIIPDIYFYDIEQTDAGGLIKTLIKGKCEIVQDITKV